ncbi:MAG: ATP-binding protein [Terriglobia bacterium]
MQESQVPAVLLTTVWQRHESRRREEQQQEQWAGLLRIAQGLIRAPGDRRTLETLVHATHEAISVDGLAIYQCQAATWQCLVAAGPRDLFPQQLPAGEPEAWPWEKAAASAATVILSFREANESLPAALVEVCGAWAAQPGEIWILPLPGTAQRPRVLVAAVPPTATRSLGPVLEVWGTFLGLTLAAGELAGAATQAQACYQWLFESLPMPAFRLDARGHFVLVNRALLEWTGRAARDLLQQSVTRFLGDGTREAFASWRRTREPSWRCELQWPTRAGPKFCQMLLRRTEQPDAAGFLGFLSDLSITQRLEQERQGLEARLQGILDSVHEGVWLIGSDGTIQLANSRLAHLLGVDRRVIGAGTAHSSVVEQVKGSFHDPERVATRWHYLNTRMEEVSWEELELVQPHHRILERFVRPLHDSTQRLIGRLEIYRDVTAQRQLEHKVIQRERLAALGQLLSGVAHELNNPLTAVGGYAQLLQRHKLPEAARLELTRLTREAERAGRIVKNLLLFARPTKPARQDVSVQDILERALEFRAYELAVENITVERQYAANLPTVWADPHQLPQVFLNILLNAEQAIRSVRDHGCIVLRTLYLSHPDRVRVEISDDGPGLPAEELAYVFEPFFTTKGANEGTGLGLTVSRSIVQEHGGEIYAERRPAGGATFAVELPAEHMAEPVAAVEPKPDSAAAVPERSLKILVVDDEDSVAHLIADVLHQQGYGVELCTNSQQALEKALEREFDLVICDIKMPEVDGEAFHRLLVERNHPLARRILFTTGDTLARSTNEFLERVGLPYLAKPFLVDELKTAVRTLLVERPLEISHGFGEPPSRSMSDRREASKQSG